MTRKSITRSIGAYWGLDFAQAGMADIFHQLEQIKDPKRVLIIDEVEGINSTYLGDFRHSIRNIYHSRRDHALKLRSGWGSVIV